MSNKMLHLWVVWVIVAFGQILASGDAAPSQVTVDADDLGQIVGFLALTTKKLKEYYTFTGIPYANPSSYTGGKRFEPSSIWLGPLNVESPDEPWYANKIANICPQRPILDINLQSSMNILNVLNSTSHSRRQSFQQLRQARKDGNFEPLRTKYKNAWGTEECLTLNINTPADLADSNNKHPVIVYVHGGSGDAFFGSVFSGHRLLEHKVILVTLNYRLGILGTFNMGVDGAPGCGAAYDIITALQWVKKYITYFGGDSEKISLVGQSAGAMLVTHVMLSPLVKDKGLFSGVVAYSGSALSVWGTATHPSFEHHLKVACLAGCYEEGSEVVVDNIVTCMKEKPVEQLILAMDMYIEEETYQGRLGYDARVPSIQSQLLTIPRFLEKDPLLILENKEQANVPFMTGSTKHDGSFALDDIYTNYLEPHGYLEDENYIKNEMLYELLTMLGMEDSSRAAHHTFARQYLGEAANSANFHSKIPGLIDMSTVFAFKAGQQLMIEEHSKLNPLSYIFSFDYKGRWTVYEVLQGFNRPIPGGIAHVDEQMYLFYVAPMLNEDARVSDRYIDYLLNFVYYGNPNGNKSPENENWKRYDSMMHNYFEINKSDKNHPNARNRWINASQELFPTQDEDDPIPTITTSIATISTITTIIPTISTTTTQNPTQSSITTTLTSSTTEDQPSIAALHQLTCFVLTLITIILSFHIAQYCG